MNIAFDCERMKYPHTGLFEYCLQLGVALKKQLKPEDQINYYLREGDQHFFDKDSKFLIQHRFDQFLFPRIKNIDLWHTAYQTSLYMPRSTRFKKVLTIHDLNFLHEGESREKQLLELKKHQKNINRADHIIAISEFTKQDILENLNIGSKPVSVIYNGCAEESLEIDTSPAYIPKKPFLYAIGTVNPKKNFHVLIPLLVNNDFELIIAGNTDDEYKTKIINEALKYQVMERVKITGPVSETEKRWYYKHCEAFLFPSLAEGFGIPPIEAMRFGKPTFLSNSTSLPEIGGDVAYYFNSYDPAEMQKVFDAGMNDYNSRHPAEDIINHAKQFNWNKSAEAYLKIYRETLNNI